MQATFDAARDSHTRLPPKGGGATALTGARAGILCWILVSSWLASALAPAQSSPDEDYANGLYAFTTAWAAEGGVSALRATADGIWAADGYGYLRLLTYDGGTGRILPNAGPYGCFNADGSLYLGHHRAVRLPDATPLFATEVVKCAFHPDNRTWAQERSGQVSVWNLSEFVALREFDAHFLALSYSPNGVSLAVGFQDHIEVLNAGDLSTRASLGPGPNFPPGASPVLAWSPDGQKIAYSPNSDRLRVYDLSGALLRTGFGVGDITSIAWSPDGELVAVGDTGGAVRIWNWSNWTPEAVEVYLAASSTTYSGDIGVLEFASRDELVVAAGIGVERWLRTTETVQAIAGPDRVARVGTTVWFDASRSRGVIPESGYRWEIGGPENATRTDQFTSFVPSGVGTYRVVLNVTDEYGHSSQSAFNLTTYPAGDDAPMVTITAPAAGAFVGLPVHIAGTASDDHAVLRVTVQIDTRMPVEAVGTTTWSLDISDLPPGYRLLHVLAYDAYQPSARTDLLFAVETGPSPNGGAPTATFVSPANGSEVKGTVTVTGHAAGPDIVEWVSFGVESKSGGFGTQATGTLSWFFIWNTTRSSDGWTNLTANATDADGEWGSAAIRVFVNNTGRHETAPPTITITEPAAGAKVTPGLLEIRGRVMDDGDSTGIQIRLDKGGWHTIPPASDWSITINVSWISAGPHVIEARVFDEWEGSNTTVSVVVEGPSSPGGPAGSNGTAAVAGLSPAVFGTIVAAVAGATGAVVLWWAGRPKSVRLRAGFVALLVVVSGGLSFAIAGMPAGPTPAPPAGGSSSTAPEPAALSTPPYEASPAPAFVCLAEGPRLFANDEFLGKPVVLVGTAIAREDLFGAVNSGQALADVDRSLSALPNDTVFIAVDYHPARSIAQGVENLSTFSAPWQVCKGQFWGLSQAPWIAEAPWLIARNGTLAWSPSSPSARNWQASLPLLA